MADVSDSRYIALVDIAFEWDPQKAETNPRKHGVSFTEAITVFTDPLARLVADPRHSAVEDRWILLGRSSRGHLLAVMHTEHAAAIRIISAPALTPRERRDYEKSSG